MKESKNGKKYNEEINRLVSEQCVKQCNAAPNAGRRGNLLWRMNAMDRGHPFFIVGRSSMITSDAVDSVRHNVSKGAVSGGQQTRDGGGVSVFEGCEVD